MFLEWLNRHPQISCHRNRLIHIFSWKKILYDTFFVHLKQREKRKLRQMQSIGEEMRVPLTVMDYNFSEIRSLKPTTAECYKKSLGV